MGVYPIRLKKILTANPPDIGAYGGRVTDGKAEGEGDGQPIWLKDADKSDLCLSGDLNFVGCEDKTRAELEY